jgi:hypothetical protein
MHGVNLDLLQAAARHHADGRPKDPHAHHRHTHLAARHAARRAAVRQAWLDLADRLRARLRTLIRKPG